MTGTPISRTKLYSTKYGRCYSKTKGVKRNNFLISFCFILFLEPKYSDKGKHLRIFMNTTDSRNTDNL